MLLGALASASPALAQDNSACVIYPNLCPPTTPTTPVQGAGPATVQDTTTPVAPTDDDRPPFTDDDGDDDNDGEPLPDETEGGPDAGRGPVVVSGRRGGRPGCRNYAILHVGDRDLALERMIRRTLGEPLWVAALREPVRVKGLDADLAGTRFAALADGGTNMNLLGRLGRRVGRELVTPADIAPDVLDTMFEYFEGELGYPSGIVLTHDPEQLSGEQDRIRDRLVRNLLDGMVHEEIPGENGGLVEIPVVGTEQSSTNPSDIPFYIDHEVRRSVDNLEERIGRQTLAQLIAGAIGHYGRKDTANALRWDGLRAERPVRCRPPSELIETDAEATSSFSGGTVGMVALLALLGAWGLAVSTRRTVVRLRRR